VTWMGSGDREVGLARTLRSFRFLRFARVLRLLRLVKLESLIDDILEHVQSEQLHIAADMVKGMCLVFALNHLLACAWYGISYGTSPELPAWVRAGHFAKESSLGYRYLTALHWSITQFTPASMEVFPCNTHERAFGVCVLVFALLVLSSFLSSVTASVTQLRQLSWKHARQSATLRKYLARRGISADLSMRVMSFVDWQRAAEARRSRETNVALLANLSDQLRADIAQEICEPTICKHKFFRRFRRMSSTCLGRICTQAVRNVVLSFGDTVFPGGMYADAMYFLLKGSVVYMQASQGSCEEVQLAVSEWCSEGALWTSWVHLGTLRAEAHSEVLKIDAALFLELTLKDHRVIRYAASYGQRFVRMLDSQAARGTLSDLSTRHAADDPSVEVSAQTLAETPMYQRWAWRARSALRAWTSQAQSPLTQGPARAGRDIGSEVTGEGRLSSDATSMSDSETASI